MWSKNLYNDVHSNTIHNNQKVGKKTNLHKIKAWWKICYIHTVDYYSVIRKMKYWYVYNIDEAWKHYAEWKKPDTKYYILCTWFYLDQISRKGKFIETESRLMVARGWEKGEWRMTNKCVPDFLLGW